MNEHDFMSILKDIVEGKEKVNYYSDLIEIAKTYSKLPEARMYGPLVVYNEETTRPKIKKWHLIDIRNGWGYYFDQTFDLHADINMTPERAAKIIKAHIRLKKEEINALEELHQLIINEFDNVK